ncbi:putative pyrroline-5-carboxylate reductase [Diplodia seriata]|uniref:Putative pyrroline-5-carboxylate reductase n=1 Tax=Diplodia seriata TaxID=420778 RepID=A0A0G2G8L7_9PEZI|nr:putative pyrroline-5-carboxylate reductase [Diplodia seriata]
MAMNILEGLPKTEVPKRIKSITACVRSEASAARVTRLLQRINPDIPVVAGGNVGVVERSDAVLLSHKPDQLQQVLGAKGMADALHGKKIISILAGVTTPQISSVLSASRDTPDLTEARAREIFFGGSSVREAKDEFDIIRAMPNIGARKRQSMTLISDPQAASADLVDFTTWLFERVGRVEQVPEAAYDAATVLNGAVYALTTVGVDGLVNGAVQQGLSHETAIAVVSQCFRGLGLMLQDGQHPAVLRDSVSPPGGATMAGLVELERRGVRAAYADAIIKAAGHAKRMGRSPTEKARRSRSDTPGLF